MADPSTGSAYFEMDQLKPADYAAIKDLKVGEISEPVESQDNEGYLQGRSGNLVYKIIRVDKIIPAHTATFENDYTQILEKVRNTKQMEAVDAFLEGRSRTPTLSSTPCSPSVNSPATPGTPANSAGGPLISFFGAAAVL